jgi:hypothetical protein
MPRLEIQSMAMPIQDIRPEQERIQKILARESKRAQLLTN